MDATERSDRMAELIGGAAALIEFFLQADNVPAHRRRMAEEWLERERALFPEDPDDEATWRAPELPLEPEQSTGYPQEKG